MVKTNWTDSGDLNATVKGFTEAANVWNRNVFGSIGKRKREVLARMKGIQIALERHRSTNLLNLETNLISELDNILDMEELLWKQKSRADWLDHGDRNTKYFHNKTMARRWRNRIEALKLNGVDWCYETNELEAATVQFLSSYTQQREYGQDRTLFEGVSLEFDEDVDVLGAEVTEEEIRSTLFEMKPLQAPGFDCLHAQFFQTQWDVVGKSVCQKVSDDLKGPPIDSDLSRILLVLIPKVESPEFLTQFRPISLCSVLYKLITKILVKKLTNIMKYIISPFQVSFIAGRCVTDNVVIAQECVHSMNSCKTKTGWMAIKVDLEKAYDRICWEFLEDSLADVGFSVHLISLIMKCVSSTSMQVLWNGVTSEEFKPSRGIRQGDPLSPYLFVIGMERLNHIIGHCVSNGMWDPIRLARKGTPISHLFFADDLVLFCKADLKNAKAVQDALHQFCWYSGHRVNDYKTQVFFSPNIEVEVADAIKNVLEY